MTAVTKLSLRYDRGDGQQHRRVLKRLPLAVEGFQKAHFPMRISSQSSHQISISQRAIASASEYSCAQYIGRTENLVKQQLELNFSDNPAWLKRSKETIGFHVVKLDALATEAFSLIGALINRINSVSV